MKKVFYSSLALIILCVSHTSYAAENYYQSGVSYFPNQKDSYIIQAPKKDLWHIQINEKKYEAGISYPKIRVSKVSDFFVFIREESDGVFRAISSLGEEKETHKVINMLTVGEKNYAYSVYDGKFELLIYNGKVIEKFEHIKKIVFHQEKLYAIGVVDGKDVIYIEGQGINSDHEKTGGIYDSKAGKRSIIPVKKDDKWYLSEENKTIHENGSDLIVDILYSENEETFYYTAKTGYFWSILNQDGKEIGKKSLYIPQFVVSEKGDNVAYISFPESGERNELHNNGEVVEKGFSIHIVGFDMSGKLSYIITDKDGNKKYGER